MTSQTGRILVFSTVAICCVCLQDSASDTNKAPATSTNAPIVSPSSLPETNTLSTNSIEETATVLDDAPAPEDVIAPVSLAKSPGLNEIIELCQAHIDETVIIAHINSSTVAFDPTPDEIIYLNDIGISPRIVTALIQRGMFLRENGLNQGTNEIASAEGKPLDQASVTAMKLPVSGSQSAISEQQPVSTQDVAANAEPLPAPDYTGVDGYSQNDAANQFYSDLAPYGSWMDVPGYGWCWQPTVVVVQPEWRPYANSGRWLYTDCGWYWQSDYSWGWAPFHYGRWFHHGRRGWVWRPDSVWGPSWVSWRRSPLYCGWAPLPPHAHYQGHGFSYHGMMVGSDFGFSLGLDDYTFISYNHFNHQNPSRFYLHRKEAASVFNKTTVFNNYRRGPGNAPVNQGIDRDHVARISRSDVKKVSVRDIPPVAGKMIKPDRVERDGKNMVLYRRSVDTPVKAAAAAPLLSTHRNEGRTAPSAVGIHGATSTLSLPSRGIGLVAEKTPAIAHTPPALNRPINEPGATRSSQNMPPKSAAMEPEKKMSERGQPTTTISGRSNSEWRPAVPAPANTATMQPVKRMNERSPSLRPVQPSISISERSNAELLPAVPAPNSTRTVQPVKKMDERGPALRSVQPSITITERSNTELRPAVPAPTVPRPAQTMGQNPARMRQELMPPRALPGSSRSISQPAYSPRQPDISPSRITPAPAAPSYTPPSVRNSPVAPSAPVRSIAPPTSSPSQPSRSVTPPRSSPSPSSSSKQETGKERGK